MTTAYGWIAFWADGHHKVRIIRMVVQLSEITPILEERLAEYCKHLKQAYFKASELTFSYETTPGNTSSGLVDTDTNEYLFWEHGQAWN